MRAPALRRRITLTGVAVVAGVLLVANVFVYLSLRLSLEDGLDELLDARTQVAAALAEELPPAQLADRLSSLAVPAQVRSADGEVFSSEPATPRVGAVGPPTAVLHPRVERTTEMTDGTTLTVYATRAGLDATLWRLVIFMGVGTAGAVVLAAVALLRASGSVVAPLRQMAATAERITAGEAAQRLAPDRPDTELGRLAASFDEMVGAQQAAVATARAERGATERFLADAAHQLRSPMAGLRASAEQLLQEHDPQSRDRLLANIVRETARASRLVSALLRIARLEHGDATRVPTDLMDVCRHEVERARGLAPHLRVELLALRPPAADAEIDPDAMRDALGNLLDNARRHARSVVQVEVTCTAGRVTIRVEDDGPGIPPEDRDRVFERFASLDGRGGSGLGLPIARGVARVHGGDLVYEEAAFVFWVPYPEGE